jgi:hypothetical protein
MVRQRFRLFMFTMIIVTANINAQLPTNFPSRSDYPSKTPILISAADPTIMPSAMDVPVPNTPVNLLVVSPISIPVFLGSAPVVAPTNSGPIAPTTPVLNLVSTNNPLSIPNASPPTPTIISPVVFPTVTTAPVPIVSPQITPPARAPTVGVPVTDRANTPIAFPVPGVPFPQAFSAPSTISPTNSSMKKMSGMGMKMAPTDTPTQNPLPVAPVNTPVNAPITILTRAPTVSVPFYPVNSAPFTISPSTTAAMSAKKTEGMGMGMSAVKSPTTVPLPVPNEIPNKAPVNIPITVPTTTLVPFPPFLKVPTMLTSSSPSTPKPVKKGMSMETEKGMMTKGNIFVNNDR